MAPPSPAPDPPSAPPHKRGRRELALVLAAAVLLASAASHGLARWLGIRVEPVEVMQMVPETGRPGIAVGGSSLTYYGVGWEAMAGRFGVGVQTNAAPSASPAELEFTPLVGSPARVRVLGMSLYELNEANLSDARPVLVPLSTTLGDLRSSAVPWAFSKNLLSRYPREALRQAFPTAGRSMHVMVGLRSKASQWLHRGGPALASVQGGSEEQKQRLADWPQDRVLRNAAGMNSVLNHEQRFDGPKRRALERILASAAPDRPLLVLVLPVSPTYQRLVAGPGAQSDCNQMLQETLRPRPGLSVLRLDQLPALQEDAVFCDLIHLNLEGRAIATPLVEEQMRTWFSGT